MTASRTRREVGDFVIQMLDAGLALQGGTPVERRTRDGTLVTWAASATADPLTPPGATGTLREYRRIIANAQYTCLLFEGSIIQMSFLYDRTDLTKYRMSFVPCPLLFGEGELRVDDDQSYINTFDEVAAADLASPTHFMDVGYKDVVDTSPHSSQLRLRATLRFDFDIAAARPGHPASHFHLTGESVRWAVFGPISVGHFVRFIFRNFYPLQWESHAFLRNWPQSFGTRSITRSEERELFVACSR
jgi:hypothetical protein